jgi:hypothetical protein
MGYNFMPTYRVWHLGPDGDDETVWVYAVDDWDAREQVAATLGLAAHDAATFGCEEDGRMVMPLNLIVHKNGELFEIAKPASIRDDTFSRNKDDA